MEHLIGQKVPQRTAHQIIGRLVKAASQRGVPLKELPLAEFQSAHESLDDSVYQVLGTTAAVAAMASHASTSPQQVQHQLEQWRRRLALD